MATHKETGYNLAVKCVPVTESGRAVLEKEINVLKKLKNTNVLNYYGMVPKGKECWVIFSFSYNFLIFF
jgi:exosome complex RNA-binding protein Rrp42 (RNase PH superfamily)